jgi:hypothetical protein
MKPNDAEVGGLKPFPSRVSRFASASGLAALLLLVGSAAKAEVVPETFDLSGNLNTVLGPLVPFLGTINVDFTNGFTDATVTSIEISVQGRVAFKQSPSLILATSAIGVIGASNSSGDSLSLTFTTPNPGTWNDFEDGRIVNGKVYFGGLTGILLGATGVITRDASNPPISDPPPDTGPTDPPPVIGPSDPPSTVAVPEPSTWIMMLIGLAGLGLAAKGRRALAFLGRRT